MERTMRSTGSKESPQDRTRGPAKIDWLEGWEADPTGHAGMYANWAGRTSDFAFTDRHTGKVPHPGFKASFLDHHARSYDHIPGPGMYRTTREFPCWDRGDENYKGLMNTGRLADSGFMTLGNTPATKKLKESTQGKVHLQEGMDVDMKYTTNQRQSSAAFSKQTADNIRVMRSLSQAKRTAMPTSFHTPGPGAYTAFSSFGSPSGGSRKRYLGTRKHDNFSSRRVPEKEGEEDIKHALASSTVASPQFKMTKTRSSFAL
mmetsp:Transcript_98373/g.175148  ORF Transcript_98373/g.175148 Transcript_98373/m.175148 type:complete len:260 (-) Transcript_98373:101-880(-)